MVAGAGVAGLAVLRALHRRGLPATGLERRAEAADGGLAINLPGNAVAALGALGLEEALQGFGRPVRRREYRTHRDRLLFAVDEQAFWGARVAPRCLRRSDLLALLGRDLPTGAVRRDAAVAAVRREGDGVTVVLAGGGEVSASLLVGADGVRSTVRQAALGGQAPDAARLASASWRFMAPDPGVEAWTLWAGPDAMLLLIPAGGGEVYGWAARTRGDGPAGAEPHALPALFATFPDRVRAVVEDVSKRPGALHHSPLEEVRPATWGRDRVVLLGDAAHATAPVWAQGAALAMEDALALADILAEGAGAGGVAEALGRRRDARVAHVQAATDRMSKAAALPPAVRTLLLPLMGPRAYRAAYGPLRPVAGA